MQEAHCKVCGEAVSLTSAMHCARCAAPYHVDCWHFVGSCSIFGCGCTQGRRAGEEIPPAPVASQLLLIDENTQLPWAAHWKPVALGWARKLRVRTKDLPRTLLASGGGAILALLGMGVFETTFGHLYGGQLSGEKSIALQIGVLYGFASPFLSQAQLDRPGFTSGISLIWFWLAFFHGPRGNVGFMLSIAFLILASTSLSEFLFQLLPSPRKPFARLLIPVRMLVSWSFMFLVLCICHPQVWIHGRPLHRAQYIELGLWAVLAVFTGGTALETGKEEMKKCLPARQMH
jgi:hypothetical protein